jgi:hypothetical protein
MAAETIRTIVERICFAAGPDVLTVEMLPARWTGADTVPATPVSAEEKPE